MSAAPAEPSALPVIDPLNSVQPTPGADTPHPSSEGGQELLEAKIHELIQACRTLDRKQREHQATAEQMATDNAKLRRILLHTHQQIQALTDQIRLMEQ